MKHRRVIIARLVRQNRKRSAGRGADDFEPFGRDGHAVAVAHPDRIAAAHFPEAIEQRAAFKDFDVGATEFGGVPALDRPAQLGAQGLLAVADGEDRQAAVQHHLRRAGRTFGHHRRWSARQYDALWLHPLERFGGAIERCDFGIDPRLAHTAGYELGHLATEIDDEDGIAGLKCHGQPLKAAAAAVHIGAAAAAKLNSIEQAVASGSRHRPGWRAFDHWLGQLPVHPLGDLFPVPRHRTHVEEVHSAKHQSRNPDIPA